ncbi:MAG: molybdenum cofactor biosynthesis protein MoaE [Bacteroidia bacterium]|nr:molybdenum cofactor biosynthesis protein MoaE [Bacteroidia bacterium]
MMKQNTIRASKKRLKGSPLFIQGAVIPELVSGILKKLGKTDTVGGHHIFLGQVRADRKQAKKTIAIEFTAYPELANKEYERIRKRICKQYKLIGLEAYHSLGIVRTGEICLMVFASAKHRKEAAGGCIEMVEEIKKKLPVWGRELHNDKSYSWKRNTSS